MKLYFFPVAPNPTKVRLYLAEKAAGGARIELEEVLVNLREGEQKRPEHLVRNPIGKLPVLELERIADVGVLRTVAQIIHATNSPLGLPPVPEVAAQGRKGLPDALRVLDQALADGRPFVAGARPSIVDCTLQAALQFARFGKVEIDPSFRDLHRWDEQFRKRPSAKAVLVA